MPAANLHSKFARDINKKLRLNEKLFLIYAQGPDTLFYDKSNIGSRMHYQKTKEFIKEIILRIRDNLSDENKVLLYGFLSHYYLDVYLHPYIFYRTGNRRLSSKYEKMHEYFEEMLDKLYVNQDKIKYSFPNIMISEDHIKILDNIGSKLYDYKIGSIFNYCYRKRRFYHKYFRGKIPLANIYLKIYFSFNKYNKKLKFDILNSAKNSWKHPVSGDIKKESVSDLYQEALESFYKIYEKIEQYFIGKISLDEIDILDVSYYTGLNKGQMKYFDF